MILNFLDRFFYIRPYSASRDVTFKVMVLRRVDRPSHMGLVTFSCFVKSLFATLYRFARDFSFQFISKCQLYSTR